MTAGQIANGIGSFLAMLTSGLFIVTWTIVGSWWKTSTGRFMVMKAGAIFMAGVLTVALTVARFTVDVDVLRDIQAGIWSLISLAFIHHTRMLIRVNRKKNEDD